MKTDDGVKVLWTGKACLICVATCWSVAAFVLLPNVMVPKKRASTSAQKGAMIELVIGNGSGTNSVTASASLMEISPLVETYSEKKSQTLQ